VDEGISGDLGRVSTHHSFSPASCDADVFLHIPLNTKEIWTGIPHQIRIPGIPDLCGTHLGREPSSDEDDEKHVSAPLLTSSSSFVVSLTQPLASWRHIIMQEQFQLDLLPLACISSEGAVEAAGNLCRWRLSAGHS